MPESTLASSAVRSFRSWIDRGSSIGDAVAMAASMVANRPLIELRRPH